MDPSSPALSRVQSDGILNHVAPNHAHSDSMVTVSLSSNSEHTQPEWRTLDIPRTPVEVTSPASAEESETRTTPTLGTAKPVRNAGASIRSRSSEDGERGEGDAVDWEELEKSEEQEPRREGSDEVRYSSWNTGMRHEIDLISRRPSCWLVWSRKTMPWPPTPSRDWPTSPNPRRSNKDRPDQSRSITSND